KPLKLAVKSRLDNSFPFSGRCALTADQCLQSTQCGLERLRHFTLLFSRDFTNSSDLITGCVVELFDLALEACRDLGLHFVLTGRPNALIFCRLRKLRA